MRFSQLKRRNVMADFGGGMMTSDADALLLGTFNQTIGLVYRFLTRFLVTTDPYQVFGGLSGTVSATSTALHD